MAKTYGYCRLNAQLTSLPDQIKLLESYHCDTIFIDQISDSSSSQPKLDELKQLVTEHDTIIIERWSHMGKNTKDLISLLDYFISHNVTVMSKKEQFNSDNFENERLLAFINNYTAFEHELAIQRTNKGLTNARARGRLGGRPKVNQTQLNKAIKLYQKDMVMSEIVAKTGISKATIYRELQKIQGKEKGDTLEANK